MVSASAETTPTTMSWSAIQMLITRGTRILDVRLRVMFSFDAWSSRRQPIVALSTMQSEYIAASEATREAVWLRRLLKNLGTTQILPTLLRCEFESVIGLAYNPFAHKRC